MQIPVIPDRLAGNTVAHLNIEIPPEAPLSTESQIKLRSLYEYVDFCRSTLGEIERDLLHLEFGPDDLIQLQKIAERLASLGIEADSWGFDSLYEIAFSLQLLLLNAGGRIQSDQCWDALQRGFRMLDAIVERCERDFRWRVAITDTLDCLTRATSD